MKCPKCGTDNNESAKFCKGCGENLQNASSSTNINTKPKSSKNTLIICATAIVCVLIVAGAFVLLSNGSSDESDVNVAANVSEDSSVDADVSENSVDTMTYTEASSYLSGASDTVIQNTFDEADKNGDGLLTGNEISKFKSLADLTERTADTSNTENVEAQDYGAGDGTTRTRYCTTHGRVAVGEDNLCPYCQEEGLDARTVKGSTEYI